jgi:hypothetical protein
MIIAVVGDSLVLPRHFEGLSYAETYPYLIAEELRRRGVDAHVWMMARGGAPIDQLVFVHNEVARYLGVTSGIGIIHVGIVDCSPRPLPYRLRLLVGRLPRGIGAMIIRFLHDNRRSLLLRGLSFRFTGPDAFRSQYRTLLGRLARDLDRVYAINISPPGSDNATRSPGLLESIDRYNGIISELVADQPKATLVDVRTAFGRIQARPTFVSPLDGHHLTREGHRWISETIASMEARITSEARSW